MKKELLILLLGWCVPVMAQEAYQGRVFADRNGNGVFDKGDRPLRDVVVSDGLNVVKTVGDGTFRLPGHEKIRFIHVTMPSGYKAEKFYHPVEGGRKSYDFGLISYEPAEKDGSHQFVQISDSEIFGDQDQSEWIRQQKEYAKNENPAFIIHTGDICYEKGLKAHIGLLNTGNTSCPVYYSVGNHDLVKGKYGEELYESIYGPSYYSFEVGNVHYIVTPMAGGDHWPSYTRDGIARWMQNDLAQVTDGKAVVVFNHDLLTYGNEFVYKGKEVSVDLNQHRLKAWLYGHWHINYVRKQGDVLAISTAAPDKGGIDHSPAVFRVMHVDGKGDLSSELRYSYLNKAISIVSVSDSLPFLTPEGKILLSVNAYHSVSPVKEVKYICWVDGKRLLTGKAVQKSDWNWGAELPVKGNQPGRIISVRVEALLKNGEVITDEKSYKSGKGTYPVAKMGDPWENLGGNPAHTGAASDVLPSGLQPLWVKNTGTAIFMASPLITDNKVIVASTDENLKGEAYVYAFDLKNGDLLWKHKMRNSIKNTIVAENGNVFAQDAEGYLYAIRLKDGKTAWEKKLDVVGLPELQDGLVAANGVVYAGAGKGLCALSVADGKELWKNKAWSQGDGTTTTGALGNGVLVTGSQWKALYGTDAATGEKLWQVEKDGLRHRGASAAIHGNFLYVISQKSLFMLETKTGKILIRKELPFDVDVTSTPLLTDKMIVFGTSGNGIVALDKETFEIKWQVKTDPALVYTAPYTRQPDATVETSPILSGDMIYVGASDGKVYGIQKDSGKVTWSFNAGAPVLGSVAVSGNCLATVDLSGNVAVFCGEK